MADYIARVQATVMFDSRSMDADRFYGSQLRSVFNHISDKGIGGLTFQVFDRYVDGPAYEVGQWGRRPAGYFRIVPMIGNFKEVSPVFRLTSWYTGVRIFLQPTIPEVDMAKCRLTEDIYLLGKFSSAFHEMLIAWSRNDWQQPVSVEVSD